jgi:hypothetical protein
VKRSMASVMPSSKRLPHSVASSCHSGGSYSDRREGGAETLERNMVGGEGEAGVGEGGRCPEDEGLGGGGHGNNIVAAVAKQSNYWEQCGGDCSEEE